MHDNSSSCSESVPTTETEPGGAHRDVKLVVSLCVAVVFIHLLHTLKKFVVRADTPCCPGNPEPRAIELQKWGPSFLLSERPVTENELTSTVPVRGFLS